MTVSAPPSSTKGAPRASRAKKRPRRGRPPKIDTEQVLQIARELFLAQGIQASTQEVARRAGVSEGTLFHRFKSKEGLFRAAMELPAEDVPALLIGAVERLEGMELEEAMAALSQELLRIARVAVPLMMMSWSNPGQHPKRAGDPNLVKFRQFLKKLAMFFEVQMDAGRLRRMDSEVLARSFLGSLYHYAMAKTWAGDDTAWIIPEGMFRRGLIDLLLNGARPRPDPAAPLAEPSPL